MKRKKSILVIAVIIAVCAALVGLWFVPLTLAREDDVRAASLITAWIVERRSLPGYWREYPDAKSMVDTDRFYVACDFLPPEAVLSSDTRVQRVTPKELEPMYRLGYEKDGEKFALLALKLARRDSKVLVIHVANMFGSLAGHGYEFRVYRTIFSLRVHGKFLWVS